MVKKGGNPFPQLGSVNLEEAKEKKNINASLPIDQLFFLLLGVSFWGFNLIPICRSRIEQRKRQHWFKGSNVRQLLSLLQSNPPNNKQNYWYNTHTHTHTRTHLGRRFGRDSNGIHLTGLDYLRPSVCRPCPCSQEKQFSCTNHAFRPPGNGRRPPTQFHLHLWGLGSWPPTSHNQRPSGAAISFRVDNLIPPRGQTLTSELPRALPPNRPANVMGHTITIRTSFFSAFFFNRSELIGIRSMCVSVCVYVAMLTWPSQVVLCELLKVYYYWVGGRYSSVIYGYGSNEAGD